MSTDPSLPHPNVSSPPRPVTQTQTISIAKPGTIVGAVLTIALGIALGLANQGAPHTEMALRVPALLAALLMVGQGVNNLRNGLPRQQQVALNPEGSSSRGRELAVVRDMAPKPTVAVVTSKPSPATLAVPITVMVLAAWLGLADLRVSAPATLSVLSVVAAFALFALGWGLLPARR
jgi:hypothetical protein